MKRKPFRFVKFWLRQNQWKYEKTKYKKYFDNNRDTKCILKSKKHFESTAKLFTLRIKSSRSARRGQKRWTWFIQIAAVVIAFIFVGSTFRNYLSQYFIAGSNGRLFSRLFRRFSVTHELHGQTTCLTTTFLQHFQNR